MKLKDLWFVSPQAFVFIVTRDANFNKTSSREYHGSGPDGDREIVRVLPTRYPMYKNVLEVELAHAANDEPEKHELTVRDLLKMDIDIDVFDNVCESLSIAFVGPVVLTPAGQQAFANVLDLPVHFTNGYAVVDVDGPEGVWQRRLNLAKRLFESAAGWCSEADYDRWFEEADE